MTLALSYKIEIFSFGTGAMHISERFHLNAARR